MKQAACLVWLVLVPGLAAAADEIAHTEKWMAAGENPGAKVENGVLEITFQGLTESSHWIVPDPAVTGTRWAMHGRVRTALESGRGYLEMRSHFPDGSQYFSRTMAETGPMAMLSGSGEWRDFVLPFFSEEGEPKPEWIELRVAVDGVGKIYLGDVSLWTYGEDEDPMVSPRVWWGGETAAIIGSVFGIAFGCAGALIGFLVSRGRARMVAIGLLASMLVAGVAGLVVAFCAFVFDQPRAVWFPFALIGLIGTAVGGVVLPAIINRYRELELRRMRARDLG